MTARADAQQTFLSQEIFEDPAAQAQSLSQQAHTFSTSIDAPAIVVFCEDDEFWFEWIATDDTTTVASAASIYRVPQGIPLRLFKATNRIAYRTRSINALVWIMAGQTIGEARGLQVR